MADERICAVDECCKPAWAKGLCPSHYARQRKYGNPTVMRRHGSAQRWVDLVAVPYSGDECLLWPFARNVRGYGTIGNRTASRYVCEIVNGAPPSPSHQAAHVCGKGHEGCVAPSHLVWKTHSENQMDRIDHGTTNRGERSASAKLTELQVRQIRKIAGTVSNRKIAAQFGVSSGHVWQIIHRNKWAAVDD